MTEFHEFCYLRKKLPLITTRRLSPGDRYWIIGFLILSASIILYTNWNGVNLTFDSYKYIRQARELQTNFYGFFEGHAPWQTLLPLLLSLSIERICTLGFWINALAILGTQFIWMQMGAREIADDWIRRFFFGSLALSTPFLLADAFLWTEALYLLLMSLFLWMFRSLGSQWSLVRIAGLILLCLLLVLTRKAALVFFLGVGLFSILEMDQNPGPTRGWRIVIWTLMGLTFSFLLYLTFNKFRPETMFANFTACLHYVGLWFLPNYVYWLLPLGLAISLWKSWRAIRLQSFERLCLVLIVTGVLARVPLYRDDLTEFDRYMSVLYPMGAYLLFWLIDKLPTTNFTLLRYAFLIVVALYQLVRISKNAMLWHSMGCNP